MMGRGPIFYARNVFDEERLVEDLRQTIETALGALGYGLWSYDWASMNHRQVLRVYLEQADGASVSVEDCAKASRYLSTTLEAKVGLGRDVVLELSSPGLDRVLERPEHYEKCMGKQANIQLKAVNADGVKRLRGLIHRVDKESVTLLIDGIETTLRLSDVAKARQHVEL